MTDDSQGPSWATSHSTTPGCAPAPGPLAWEGFRGFSSAIRKAILPLLQSCPPAGLSLGCQSTGAVQQTPQHLSFAASCHPNPAFLLNATQKNEIKFKFQKNPLSLDPKVWSRALFLLYLLQVILHPEFNPSACFSDTMTPHLCSELVSQYSHHLKENQENYLRQKKQISCADRINTFGVRLCQHLSFL